MSVLEFQVRCALNSMFFQYLSLVSALPPWLCLRLDG